MKLIAAGVTLSAAMQRSPSFSRSSSSTMITSSPWRYSSAASSTVANGMMVSLPRDGRTLCAPTDTCRAIPALPRDLETLLERVGLLRHRVDDLHLQRVVAGRQ